MRIAKRIVKQVIVLLMEFASITLGSLLRKKGLVIFSQAKERYFNNSRYLFEYLCKQEAEVYWLYSSEAQKKKIPDKYHNNTIARGSLQGVLLALRADNVIISHGGSDFGLIWHLVKRKYVLNLWHAIMMKHCGILAEGNTPRSIRQHLKKETKYYSAMIVSSDIERYFTSASHGIDARKVKITGTPKTDKYLSSFVYDRDYTNKSKREWKVLYAPTWRDYNAGRIFFPFENYCEKKFGQFFSLNPNITIYLRPHPNDTESLIQVVELEQNFKGNIVNLSQSICDDIDEMLWGFDAIITDYSSIYVEPLLKDICCIFVPFDYKKYLKTRGLPYDYEMVTPGPKVTCFEGLLDEIKNTTNGATEWKVQRQIVRDMFFNYKDDKACRRISETVLGLKLRYLD